MRFIPIKSKAPIAIAATVVMMLSCKKVLDVQPYTVFSDLTAFDTPARIESAINGVYDAAQSGFYASAQVRGYPFGAASIEQGEMRGEDMNNDQAFYQVTYESTQNSTSANQRYMFENLYALINTANVAIAGVNSAVGKGVISSELGNHYIGEARFMRAMAHHELLLNYARPYSDANGTQLGIIYREVAINSDAAVEAASSQTRTSVADNYSKVLADLDFAEANLNAAGFTTPTGIAIPKTFRASKAAAIALKMRVKMHMGDWQGVITEGNKIVNASFTSPIGTWKLMPNPGDAFVLPGNTDENVFSIKNDAADNPNTNGSLPRMMTSPATSGRGLVKISPIAYNLPAWRCDDKRRSLLVMYTPSGATANASYFTTKYKDAVNQSDPAPHIRYAEVILMLAEAEARTGASVSSRAIDLLNAVRNRALAEPATQKYTAADFAGKNDLIKAILVERRIELLAEGKRWGDIHRLATDATFGTGGIPAKIGNGSIKAAHYVCGAGSTPYMSALTLGAIPYADFRFIWPIPLSETQTNPNYAQNTNY